MDVNPNRILVLALGSEALMDEGIPIRLLNDLAHEYKYDHIDYEILAFGGINLMEAMEGYETAVLIDSIKTPGGIPGTVYHFSPENFKESFNLSSQHDLSFLQALEFGKMLDFKMPRSIHILAVEIVENRILGEAMSPLLHEKYDTIFDNCRYSLEGILNSREN
jgi:hydrogenase maturation protease